jgi:hypothetical protein
MSALMAPRESLMNYLIGLINKDMGSFRQVSREWQPRKTLIELLVSDGERDRANRSV